jgi:hypothetical protein
MLAGILETTAGKIGAVAAIILGVGVIWKQVIGPFIRAIITIANGVNILIDISQEFRNNGGVTLKDVVDGIKEDTAAVRTELSSLRGEFNAHRVEDWQNFEALTTRQERIELHVTDALRNQARDVEAGVRSRPNPPEVPG